jgi:hypothetical protein
MSFSVMPDLRSLPRTLIRGHPEDLERTGFRLEFIPMKIGAGMTILIEGAIYKQTLIKRFRILNLFRIDPFGKLRPTFGF